MSSHREAPEISKDPVADSTDVYAFVTPGDTSTVTLIANYIPLEHPDGGPNFYEFGDDVSYRINVDNDGDGDGDISFRFTFSTTNTIPTSFLYNDGPIQSLTDPNWNRKQTYTVEKVWYDDNGTIHSEVLGSGLTCPPCNIGPLSTPNYASALAAPAVHSLGNGITVFAGQRAEGFYVDLGAVFDLGNLRPFEEAHNTFGLSGLPFTKGALGINSTDMFNVHTLAIQVPISQLVRKTPTGVTDPAAVIGVWTSAFRQQALIRNPGNGQATASGPYVRVSRLGNPLVNELLIPLGEKDYWNKNSPADDYRFAQYIADPLLARLLPVLYPGVFPNLAAYNAGKVNRADLSAVLLTGIPNGVVPGVTFSTSMGTTTPADMLRLNVMIPPNTTNPSNLGLIGGDIAGFPNGRRVFDDVATIELRAVAGAILGLVDPAFKPDAAAGAVTFGLTNSPTDLTAKGTEFFLSSFPYLGTPHSGFNVQTPAALMGQ